MRSDGGDERDSRRLRLLSARRLRHTAFWITHAPSVTHRPLFFSTRFIKLHRVRGVLMVVDGWMAGRLQASAPAEHRRAAIHQRPAEDTRPR